MATAWKVALGISVGGWFVAPVIAFYMPKVLAYLGFDIDTSTKFEHLQLVILQQLEKTLPLVDEARIVNKGRSPSEVKRLNTMAASLRHAQEDAEDIDHDHHSIEHYRRKWSQRPIATCLAWFIWICVWIARIFLSGLAWLMLCFMGPRLVIEDQGTSHEGAPANEDLQAASDESAWAAAYESAWPHMTAPSLQGALHQGVPENGDLEAQLQDAHMVWSTATTLVASIRSRSSWLLRWFKATALVASIRRISFDVFKNHCRYIIHWPDDSYEKACVLRDLSYQEAGYTSKQGVLDCLLTAIPRRNLMKRIEEVESTVNKVIESANLIISKCTKDVTSEKKSTPKVSSETKSTPGVSSEKKSTPDDIVKEKRTKIKTASNHNVFGLEVFRNTIMAKLRMTPESSSTSACYSSIGIHGLSGSGKTTFALYIRDHIKEKCEGEDLFDIIMCIQVSETFSVKKIFRNMLKGITNQENSNMSDVEVEKKLKILLHGKRFFLILDDLWVEDKKNKMLQKLISPLQGGLKGSKILVTAQKEGAAGVLCVDKGDTYPMPILEEDDYFSMLMHYALDGKSVVDQNLTLVGRDIAKKLSPSPIAAAIVGARLGANQDVEAWKIIEKLDMLSETRAALWWSYKQFCPDRRRCFEYCNIFPKNSALKKGNIVCLWIAQGFVKTINEKEDKEAIAESYIEELVSLSFLRKDPQYDDVYRIHDMLHDLVDNITGTDYFIIEYASGDKREGKKQVVPRDVRHLFFQNYDAELINWEIPGLDNLRTLIIYGVGEDTTVEEEVIDSICRLLPKLRVLGVAFVGQIKQPTKFSFPKSISRLKHLCYLAFRTSNSCELIFPNALTELLHIQMLYFGDAKICNIGRLTSLQEMKHFTVRGEEGYELHQLGGLDKLHSTLAISGLENVKSQDEAVKANLSVKKRLRKLILLWPLRSDVQEVAQADLVLEEKVLESLCPPVKLQELEIFCYKGSAYPSWMEGREKGGPKDLKHLELWGFPQRGSPPNFVEAFSFLRVLELWSCSWDVLPGNFKDLTSLEELEIAYCPNIRSIPILSQSVLRFTLRYCNVEFMESCRTPGDPNYEKVVHIPMRFINQHTYLRGLKHLYAYRNVGSTASSLITGC
ncbi:unnamed protein product [Alopecurus aequalis]